MEYFIPVFYSPQNKSSVEKMGRRKVIKNWEIKYDGIVCNRLVGLVSILK